MHIQYAILIGEKSPFLEQGHEAEPKRLSLTVNSKDVLVAIRVVFEILYLDPNLANERRFEHSRFCLLKSITLAILLVPSFLSSCSNRYTRMARCKDTPVSALSSVSSREHDTCSA